MKDVKDLPSISDEEFWGKDAYKVTQRPIRVQICEVHTKDHWKEGIAYEWKPDGTIICTLCGWGCMDEGRYRTKDGKIVDLRLLRKQ